MYEEERKMSLRELLTRCSIWRKKRRKPHVRLDGSCGHESLISIRYTAVSYLYAFIYIQLCLVVQILIYQGLYCLNELNDQI